MPEKIQAVGPTQNKWLGQRRCKTNRRVKGKKDRAAAAARTKPGIKARGLDRLKMVREFLHQQNVNDAKEFLGSPDTAFKEGEDVVISFPGGIHGAAWNAMLKSKGLVTTCVMLPKGQLGHVEHPTWFDGKCYCIHLYGQKGRWGCVWFEKWLMKLQVARDRGCNLIFVTRRDFSLGPSQKGVLAWLAKERIPIRLMSIDEFAVEFFGRARGFTDEGRKILDMNASDKIDFHGSAVFHRSQLAIVSYPGAHGYGWNQLTQGSSLGKHDIVTSCIFLPTESSPGYGEHPDRGFGRVGSYNDDFFHRDGCHCDYLYPFPKYRTRPAFGCAWYEMWTKKTLEARDRGCHLVVVTKQDGTLGNSQEGEVRFLKNQGIVYERISISEFALMLLI
eukprot:Skav210943  [mRNA]  locus=scaffold713:206536:207702:+ [translate_table: standard]